jgi:hypothetical protein
MEVVDPRIAEYVERFSSPPEPQFSGRSALSMAAALPLGGHIDACEIETISWDV